MQTVKTLAALLFCVAATGAHAGPIFVSFLDSTQEVGAGTPNADGPVPALPATGNATLRLDGGSGTWSLFYEVVVDGLDWGALFDGTPRTPDTADDVTRFHIHSGARGANGPVVYGMFAPSHDFDADLSLTLLGPTTARITGTWSLLDGNPVGNLVDFVPALLAAAPGSDLPLYFNVHTTSYPAGEIRGQLQAAVAVPATLALLVPGLVGLGLNRHRHRHSIPPQRQPDGG